MTSPSDTASIEGCNAGIDVSGIFLTQRPNLVRRSAHDERRNRSSARWGRDDAHDREPGQASCLLFTGRHQTRRRRLC
jgi:hypothetical protein